MELFTVDNLVSFATLTALEIVLGIDNLIFIAILVGRLPAHQREVARRLGLGLAFLFRVILLLLISWLASLTAPLFSVMGFEISGRDMILIGGGLFLMAKSTHEIHNKLEGEEVAAQGKAGAAFGMILAQIVAIDMVFSLDSVITAIGLVDSIAIMIAAVFISLLIMLIAAPHISSFIEKHPTFKILALAFLLMVGMVLMAEGLHFHVPKGYIYFSMAFSLFVEVINIKMRKHAQPVRLHQPYGPLPEKADK